MFVFLALLAARSLGVSAAAPVCTFTPSSQELSISWAQTSQIISAISNRSVPPGADTCVAPPAMTNVQWLTSITPTETLIGEGQSYITAIPQENTGTASRKGYITIGGGFTINVQQSGYPRISCKYSPTRQTVKVPASGGQEELSFSVIQSGNDGCIIYAPSSTAVWITNLYPDSNQAVGDNTSQTTVLFSIEGNSGPARVAEVTLTKNLVIKVEQAAAK